MTETQNQNPQIQNPIPIPQLALVQESWARQGPALVDYQKIHILYVLGKAYLKELETIDEGYPHRLITRYAFIPTNETKLIVLMIEGYDEADNYKYEKYCIYIKGHWYIINEYGEVKEITVSSENLGVGLGIRPEELSDKLEALEKLIGEQI